MSSPRDHAQALAATNRGWPIERVTGLMAGTAIVTTLALGYKHSPRWHLMTGLIGANLALQATAGWCPASLGLRMLGMRGAREGRAAATD